MDTSGTPSNSGHRDNEDMDDIERMDQILEENQGADSVPRQVVAFALYRFHYSPSNYRGLVLRTMAEQRSQRLIQQGHSHDYVLRLMNRWVERMNTPRPPREEFVDEEESLTRMRVPDINRLFPATLYRSPCSNNTETSQSNNTETSQSNNTEASQSNSNSMSSDECMDTSTNATITTNTTNYNYSDSSDGSCSSSEFSTTITTTTTTGSSCSSNVDAATASASTNATTGDNNNNNNNIEECCCVCLLEMKDGDLVRTLPCNHVIHKECVDEWLQKNASCPLCRLGLLEDREETDN